MPDDDGSAAARGLPAWFLIAAILAGVVVRVVILATPLGRPDADEVLSGLMARHVGDQGWRPFLWEQNYGGTIELGPVVASMKLLGWSTLSMRVPQLLLYAVNSVLLWRVARRVLPEDRAQLAGLLLWVGFPAALWLGTREQLLYFPIITFGLGLAISAARWREAHRWYDALVFGLCAGLGFWTSPTIGYFAVPAAVVALRGGRWADRVRLVVLAGAAALVGVWPWLQHNLRYDWASLHASETFPTIGTYPERLGHLFSHGLPGILGFREVFTYDWVLGPIGIAAYLGALGLLGLGLSRSTRSLAWDAVGLLWFPLMFAAIPWVMDDPNQRYLVFFTPFLAAGFARVATSRRAQVGLVAAALVITGLGLQRLYVVSEVDGTRGKVGNVGELDQAIRALDQLHVDRVYGDYWVAYRLVFETDERILATPSWGIDRFKPYTEAVRASDRVAWVVLAGPQTDALTSALDALAVPYEQHPAGAFTVILPTRPVHPDQLPEAARHPVAA